MIHLEQFHLFLEHLAELRDGHALVFRVGGAAARVDRGTQKVCHGHAWDGDRILERQKQTEAGTFVGFQFQQILSLESDLTFRDSVIGMPHQRIRQRGLACAVRSHDGVHLALLHGQVKAFQDFLIFDTYVEVFDLKLRHIFLQKIAIRRTFSTCGIIAGSNGYVNIYDIFLVYYLSHNTETLSRMTGLL